MTESVYLEQPAPSACMAFDIHYLQCAGKQLGVVVGEEEEQQVICVEHLHIKSKMVNVNLCYSIESMLQF